MFLRDEINPRCHPHWRLSAQLLIYIDLSRKSVAHSTTLSIGASSRDTESLLRFPKRRDLFRFIYYEQYQGIRHVFTFQETLLPLRADSSTSTGGGLP